MLDLWVCNVKAPPILKALMVQVQQDLELFMHSPATHRQSFNSSVILCGCSNYSCSCYLYQPIKHLLMMILSLDQWGKLTYRKPGFLTSQPGFLLTWGNGIIYLCCPIPIDSLPASNCAQYPPECIDIPAVIKQSIKMHNYTFLIVCTSLAKLHGIISTS